LLQRAIDESLGWVDQVLSKQVKFGQFEQICYANNEAMQLITRLGSVFTRGSDIGCWTLFQMSTTVFIVTAIDNKIKRLEPFHSIFVLRSTEKRSKCAALAPPGQSRSISLAANRTHLLPNNQLDTLNSFLLHLSFLR